MLVMFAAILACARAVWMDGDAWSVSREGAPGPAVEGQSASQTGLLPAARGPGEPINTPTPDPPHALPPLPSGADQYIVRAGDTLNQIAQRYSVSVNEIAEANNLASIDLLEIGQTLVIPPPNPQGRGPDFKIIPDSELVYGPASVDFDITAFINEQGGYLSRYTEEVEDRQMSGAQILTRVAQEYSLNPRLLLAILEYQSGWVSQANPEEATLNYPIGVQDAWRAGLYRQLAWAANFLNSGYYLWRVNGLAAWSLPDGSIIPIAPTINAGTAGVQHFFSLLLGRPGWEAAVSPEGFFATYNSLFSYPFDLAVEPLLPSGLTQPPMQLPFEPGQTWSFTGGPHGGWGSGSAWAALDFAPPGQALGCVQSEAWIVAVADGLIVRSDNGAVVQDLDGDGYEQTGWTVFYLHVETRERVPAGTYLRAGERIGHPSCEGGVSSGTHLHIARRYNGEWIPADQDLPFVLDGWVSRGAGQEYDGYMVKDGQTIEALVGRYPENAIER